MKKMWMLILAAALLLSLVACSNSTGDTSAQNYHVGETVSTDIVDFTLNDCALSIYANEMGNEGFLKPAEGGNIYGAKVGSSLIIPSFTVTNKDRSGSINIEDTGGDLNLNWVVRYNGKKYNVTQFDLNSDGISGMSLSSAAIIDPDSGDMIEKMTQVIIY